MDVASPSPDSDDADKNGLKKNRFEPGWRARKACVHCRRAHVTCSDCRPCPRCVQKGLDCFDPPSQHRQGRRKKKQKNDFVSHLGLVSLADVTISEPPMKRLHENTDETREPDCNLDFPLDNRGNLPRISSSSSGVFETDDFMLVNTSMFSSQPLNSRLPLPTSSPHQCLSHFPPDFENLLQDTDFWTPEERDSFRFASSLCSTRLFSSSPLPDAHVRATCPFSELNTLSSFESDSLTTNPLDFSLSHSERVTKSSSGSESFSRESTVQDISSSVNLPSSLPFSESNRNGIHLEHSDIPPPLPFSAEEVAAASRSSDLISTSDMPTESSTISLRGRHSFRLDTDSATFEIDEETSPSGCLPLRMGSASENWRDVVEQYIETLSEWVRLRQELAVVGKNPRTTIYIRALYSLLRTQQERLSQSLNFAEFRSWTSAADEASTCLDALEKQTALIAYHSSQVPISVFDELFLVGGNAAFQELFEVEKSHFGTLLHEDLIDPDHRHSIIQAGVAMISEQGKLHSSVSMRNLWCTLRTRRRFYATVQMTGFTDDGMGRDLPASISKCSSHQNSVSQLNPIENSDTSHKSTSSNLPQRSVYLRFICFWFLEESSTSSVIEPPRPQQLPRNRSKSSRNCSTT